MVTEMTKYSFILPGEETEGFLRKLQELGVMDITRSAKPVDETSSTMLENASAEKKALAVLDKADWSEDPDAEEITAAASTEDVIAEANGADPAECAIKASERLTELAEALSVSKKKAAKLYPWGEFDRKAIEGLKNIGLKIRYYSVPKKSFDESWAERFPLQVVTDDGKTVWFVTVCGKDEEYDFPLAECTAPDESFIDAEKEKERILKKIIRTKGLLLKLTERRPEIREKYDRQLTELDLYLAEVSGESAVENRIVVFEGFAPAENDAELRRRLDEEGVFYLTDRASVEDNPPIKLRNNRFSRMFEVLTGMYGMPAYDEFDLTPVLGPFFLLFFALCLGDAGYGLVLVLLSFIIKKKMPGMAKLSPLVMTLGIGTFFIGILMNTFFGFSLVEQSFIPEWLKKCIRPLQGEVEGFPATMVLAICIGILNICVAMVIKAVCYTHRFGLKDNLGTWGWTLFVVGGVILGGTALFGLLQSEVIKWIFIVLAVISGLGIYIFNKPGRNPFVNIGAGLWDTYNMATGLLSDTLSFIRLYALGLAGGMLGSTFNTLGGMLMESCHVPGLNWLLFAVIFVIGHALNIALSCLGAFVHPLRLTFVEFFKNSGYEGSGKPYNPLSVKKDEA